MAATRFALWLAALPLTGLSACAALAPVPGTPEYVAAQVSRGYDCGLRVDRAGILARLPRDERQRFFSAASGFAVKAYKAPRPCDSAERLRVRKSLVELGSGSISR